MNSLLGVNQLLSVLRTLRSTLWEFAAKEAALEKKLRAARSSLADAREAGLRNYSARLQEGVAAADAKAALARDALEKRWSGRQERIEKAFKASRKSALDKITEREGRQKYKLQKRALEAERQRESDLAAAAARLESIQARLRDFASKFQELTLSAHRAARHIPEFQRMLAPERTYPVADTAADEEQLLTVLGRLAEESEANVKQLRRNSVLGLFRLLPIWLVVPVLLLAGGTAAFVAPRYGLPAFSHTQAALVAGAGIAWLIFYLLSKSRWRPVMRTVAQNLAQAGQIQTVCSDKAEQTRRKDDERIKAQWEETNRQLDDQWQQVLGEAEQARASWPERINQKRAQALAASAALRQRSLDALAGAYQAESSELRGDVEAEQSALLAVQELRSTELNRSEEKQWRELTEQWEAQFAPLWSQLCALKTASTERFRDWNDPQWDEWVPPTEIGRAVRFGSLRIDWARFTEGKLPARLGFPGTPTFEAPLLLTYPREGSLLHETGALGMEKAAENLTAVVFRLLGASPPGQVQFTLLDPAGLGQSFAALMHLADFEDNPIQSRIWTQTSQIEEKLGELSEHVEKVIQMYLRDEFPTIVEYNAQAKDTPEKYHVLVVAGFPMNFSELAIRRLLHLAVSGARCGVYTLVAWDQRHVPSQEFVPDELRRHSVRVLQRATGFGLAAADSLGTEVLLDAPPPAQFAARFLQMVGQGAIGSNRVELPFAQVAPEPSQQWTEDSAQEIRVPIGRTGAAKLQYLSLGRGTRQHGLIAGKTGSGKSNLFHVIITNLALWYGPDQVEFYLVDFKKGVEFKCYAANELPHARVVAIESDREFGLSVLQRVDDELRRRGALFRKAGVQDLSGFRRETPDERLPRVLLMIDEFQEFFTEEDRISQSAAVLLDRIVRQGRAFGVHVLLGSQTLGGAYTLARATIGQMVVRIALQCNEADSYLIMDESNAAPRLLSRPGEGVYNDMAGALQGNSPFQVVWFPDEVRDRYLAAIQARSKQLAGPLPAPLIFEGNVPAEISENATLEVALETTPEAAPVSARVWLGAPNSIKGPTEVRFQPQSGSNLLIVGQNEEAAAVMVASSLISLAVQHPKDTLRLVLLESTVPGARERELIETTLGLLGHAVERPTRFELPKLLNELAIRARGENSQPNAAKERTFIIVFNLQGFKQLQEEDEFSFRASDAETLPSPAASFKTILTDGPSQGLHVITSIDTYNNVTRFLGRKSLSEFQARVLFQMSPTDSASLIDAPDASRLGLHNALLYQEREGSLEKFRPYALPDSEWLEKVAAQLRRRREA